LKFLKKQKDVLKF